jgi:tetratricopeptide (TPR) repeat protein
VDVDAELEGARQAHLRRRWADAADAFTEIDAISPLDVDDLDRLAEALDLVGRGDDAIAALHRVYVARVDAMEIGKALRNAFWLYRALAFNAEFAQAGAWIARARRLTAEQTGTDEHGYLLLPAAERELRDGDYQSAFATAEKAAGLGARCADRHVVTVAVHLQGRARVGEGRISEGLGLLDEAMLAISAGETSSRSPHGSTARRFRPASRCTTCAGPASGRSRSTPGAIPCRSSPAPIQGSAASIAPSCCSWSAPGPRLPRRPGWHAGS